MADQHTVSLEITDPSGYVSQLVLAGQRFVIGRQAEAEIYLGHGSVSRRHAEIYCDPFRRWWLRDLGSRNGTLLNGKALPEQAVHAGDVIGVGDILLKVLAIGDSRPEVREEPASNSSNVFVSDSGSAAISVLPEIEPPRLSSSHLAILNTFGQRLLQLEDPNDRLHELCCLMVRPEFHGRCALVMRLSKDRPFDEPRVLCPVEACPQWAGWTPYISRTLLRVLRQREQPILASNAAEPGDAAEISLSVEVLALSAVACPIRSDQNVLDVLYAVLPPECGTGEWLALAALASKQYQQAEITWAARKQQAMHAAIERELDQARQIQTRLVPADVVVQGLDVAIGFKPCRWVGGDYVDVLRTADGRILLTVADVCGKGMPAALVASSLHSTIRVAVRAGMSLAELMRHLNEHLAECLSDSRFVTMVSLLLDPASGAIECINTGHPPPLIITPTGQLRCGARAANPPLGLCPHPPVAEADQIRPGELLALFTDGLSDLANPAGFRLGDEELYQQFVSLYRAHPTLPAAELAGRLTHMLDEFQSDALSQDDRTFLLARRAV